MVITDEYQLRTKVVAYIRSYHKTAIVAAGLGELQDCQSKRIQAWRNGYTRGQPDIMILNCSGQYIGLAIEFKSPQGSGVVSDDQKWWHECLATRGWHVLVSNEYDEIIHTICTYMAKEKWICQTCQRWTKRPHKHKISTNSTCSESDTVNFVKPEHNSLDHIDNPPTDLQAAGSVSELRIAALSAYEFCPSGDCNDASTSAAVQIQMDEATCTRA